MFITRKIITLSGFISTLNKTNRFMFPVSSFIKFVIIDTKVLITLELKICFDNDQCIASAQPFLGLN